MNETQLKEINSVENKLKGRQPDFSYVIPGFTGKSLPELCSHLQVQHALSPDEVILFIYTLLSQVGLGWCIPKPLLTSIHSLTYGNFDDKFEEGLYRTIQMRSFVLRVYHELDVDLRSSFQLSICHMAKVNPDNFANSYKLFKYIENAELIHSKDESGLKFFFSALKSNGQYAKVLTFAKEHILYGTSIEHFGRNYSFM